MDDKSLLHIYQQRMVTFRVNMSEAYPTNGVYIGSDWAGWSLDKFQQLTDANNDSIFELTVYLSAGNSYNSVRAGQLE
ncbi:MAG: hypothetical protein IPH45_18495 [Bacteroidales bacterium]|nr:hypothetical protein [Bacteroidales bacterium]